MEPRKQAIIDALRTFVRQRPGLDFANYGDVSSYRSEARRIAADRRHAGTLLAAVAGNDDITADMIVKASESAFSGRLGLYWVAGCSPPQIRLAYCTGQYFATEYRKAVCAVLASALWYYVREHCMPRGDLARTTDHGESQVWHTAYGWMSPGYWLRDHFRREFGRTIAARYFQ